VRGFAFMLLLLTALACIHMPATSSAATRHGGRHLECCNSSDADQIDNDDVDQDDASCDVTVLAACPMTLEPSPLTPAPVLTFTAAAPALVSLHSRNNS
jgi:hypothetical protein